MQFLVGCRKQQAEQVVFAQEVKRPLCVSRLEHLQEFVEQPRRGHVRTRRRDLQPRDAVVLGGSADNEFCHLAWRKDHEDLRDLKIPLIAAPKLARELGILDVDENVCLRATFIVDPHGIVQFACCNNLSVGRNVKEVIRVLDAIQSDELCPCNWKKGDETIKA